jgi:hypothetical protein
MRERTLALLPSALASAFVLLLTLPTAAVAQSGSAPAITMIPATAEAGATVEVAGIGFPRATTVVIELTTSSGPFALATVATDEDGAFRDAVSLPANVPAGALGLSARAAGGSSASYALGGTLPAEASATQTDAATATTAAATPRRSSSNGYVLAILGVVLGVLAIAAMFAWRAIYEEKHQPGMGVGDDVIWNEGDTSQRPELTASDEPFWQRAGQEPGVVVDEATPDGSVTGEQELPASA